MRKLKLEGIRCFTKIEAPLAPLTLLVGENSTGKSSFLALIRIAWHLGFGRSQVEFNEEPFELGTYDDIARFHGGRGKRVTNLVIGSEHAVQVGKKSVAVEINTTFASEAGQPEVIERVFTFPDFKAVLTKGTGLYTYRIVAPSGDASFSVSGPNALAGVPVDLETVCKFLLTFDPPGRVPFLLDGTIPATEDLRRLNVVASALREDMHSIGRPYAFAPIRTRPRRTYDPLQVTPTPEGGHVPALLARLHAAAKDDWQDLATELKRFGQASGMFSNLDVRHLGKEESDPFKIVVRVEGQQARPPLVDVGYGVSQVLPLLVDAVRGSRFLLLQQPEVHLHPRAQAELGSFLGRLVTKGGQVVVETHSDHLLNRVCLDVRRGEAGLRPEHVVILYFERHQGEVRVHPMHLDAQGNLLGAPDSYRDFFIREELEAIGADVPDR